MSAGKSALRAVFAERRAGAHGVADPAPALGALREVLEATEGPVSFFWPIRTEIDPRPVMEALAASRPVGLPVTRKGMPLSFRRWQGGAEMVPGGFGVEIPAEEEEIVPEVLVVPLLAFDAACHRLGYGAGHYDRTLEALRRDGPVTAIGFAYEAQFSAAPLPAEVTDQPLDMVITEAGLRRPGVPLAMRGGGE